MLLLSVPNVSEGRDLAAVGEIGAGFGVEGVRVVDVHSDFDHHRTVFTLVGSPERLVGSVLAGARAAIEKIDLRRHEGVHPRVGALDVAPMVYPSREQKGLACAAALTLGDRLGEELALPVFLYGELGGGRTRAEVRRGGLTGLAARMKSGELKPDFGPSTLHPTAGAVLVSARPPLVAFNVDLDAEKVSLSQAKEIATLIRESGAEGLPGVRALGIALESRGIVQVSTNIEDTERATATDVLLAVRKHTPVLAAELVGLAPRSTFADFPFDVELLGYDPSRSSIESVLETTANRTMF